MQLLLKKTNQMTRRIFNLCLTTTLLASISLFSGTSFADLTTDQSDANGDLIVAEEYYGPGGIVSSADDASFANTSYLVIDHGDGSTPIAYGYRWNDAATTGETMFSDIVFGTLGNSNDEELFAKVQTFSFGKLIVGIGYNSDDDTSWGDLSDGTVMTDFATTNGIFETAQTAALVSSVDVSDSYQEGDSDFTRGWVYFDADSNPYTGPPSGWGDPAGVGFSDRILTDGAWDGWVFDSDFTVFGDQAPGTPETVAVPEPGSLLFLWAGGITIWLRRPRR